MYSIGNCRNRLKGCVDFEKFSQPKPRRGCSRSAPVSVLCKWNSLWNLSQNLSHALFCILICKKAVRQNYLKNILPYISKNGGSNNYFFVSNSDKSLDEKMGREVGFPDFEL